MISGLPLRSYRASQDKSHARFQQIREMYSAHIPKTEQLPPKQTRWIKKKCVFVLSFGLTGSCFHLHRGAKSCCHTKRRERIDHVGRRRRSQFHLTMLISAWEETPPHLFIWYAARAVYFPTSIKRKKQQQQQLRNKRSLPTWRKKKEKIHSNRSRTWSHGTAKSHRGRDFKKQNKKFKIWVQTVILNTHASPTATLKTVFKKLWHKWVKWRFARVALLPSTV